MAPDHDSGRSDECEQGDDDTGIGVTERHSGVGEDGHSLVGDCARVPYGRPERLRLIPASRGDEHQ